MSGKYTNKKQLKRRRLTLLAVVVCLAVLCAAVAWLLTDPPAFFDETPPAGTDMPETSPATAGQDETQVQTRPVRVEELEQISIPLSHGLRITDVGKYTGVYMEDGTDEIVANVLMIAVTNEGEADIQYAEIAMPVGGETAEFTLSTLPVGATVILLETGRMEYVSGEYTTAEATSVALFQNPMSLREDLFELQILDGAINITNISGTDIAGDIVIYYKNSAADVYYGGITYRVRLQGGMKAGEVRQILASHFSQSGSSVMFIECGAA